MVESQKEYFRDFALGFFDGLITPFGLSVGLYLSGVSREMVMLTIFLEAVSASISMSVAHYISEETIQEIGPWSGVRTGLGYFSGAMVSFISYYLTSDISNGFKLSIAMNLVALIVFGYAKAIITNLNIMKTIREMVELGVITFSAISGVSLYQYKI